MQAVSHGVDLVEIARIARIWSEHGDYFARRVFTPAELEYCLASRSPEIRLAGRFAAKEAVLKVLGTGWRGGIQWTDIEVLPDGLGKPIVALAGRTAALAAQLGLGTILLSISHAGQYAIASAVGLRAAAESR
jgi:holo-[acyl-carrier protein] synthase